MAAAAKVKVIRKCCSATELRESAIHLSGNGSYPWEGG